MTFEVRTNRLKVLARGAGYGCAAGAAVALLPGLLLGALWPGYLGFVLVFALGIGMAIGVVAGFLGELALAGYCVPGPVTPGSARRVAATAMCVLSLAEHVVWGRGAARGRGDQDRAATADNAA